MYPAPGSNQNEFGRRVAFLRKRRGYSQIEFARKMDRSETWVSQVERGVRRIDRMSVLERLAATLDVPVSDLAPAEPVVAARSEPLNAASSLALLLASNYALRAMIAPFSPVDLADVEARAELAWEYTHATQYDVLADLLTDLVPSAEVVSRQATEDDKPRAHRARARIYLAAAGALVKLGETGPAWVAINRLNSVLRRHLEATKHDVDLSSITPVRREDDKVGIVDLMLGRASRGSRGREHLIVELKAPKVSIGSKEVDQIKSYADAVVSDPQFVDNSVRWDFWIVSTDMSSIVKRDADSANTPQGCVVEWDNSVRVRAKTWSDLINECEERLHYYRDCLNFDASENAALDHLRLLHNDLIPEQIRGADREEARGH